MERGYRLNRSPENRGPGDHAKLDSPRHRRATTKSASCKSLFAMRSSQSNSPTTLSPRQGLTLLELLAVIVLVAIVGRIAITRIQASKRQAQINACYENRAMINKAAENYFSDRGTRPTTLAQLAPYLPGTIPRCPVSNRAYTLSAATGRVVGHNGVGASGGH